MSCIDLNKLNTTTFDIARTIDIPIRTPYTLSLKPGISCPSGQISLYDSVSQNNYTMGGIILDKTASMICDIAEGIVCDTLQAYNITIKDSNCGISQGSYDHMYLTDSVLTNSIIQSNLLCCHNALIHQSQFKINSSMDIISTDYTTIIESK